MKAEFREDGYLWIVPQTIEEGIALAALEEASSSKGYSLPPYIGLDCSEHAANYYQVLNPEKYEQHLICEDCNRLVGSDEAITYISGGVCKHIECPTDAMLCLNDFSNKVEQLAELAGGLGIELGKKQKNELARKLKDLEAEALNKS